MFPILFFFIDSFCCINLYENHIKTDFLQPTEGWVPKDTKMALIVFGKFAVFEVLDTDKSEPDKNTAISNNNKT
jgi:hypothetical protein